MPAIDLTKPLEWTKSTPPQRIMLRALQGNILKGHGRHFTANIFIAFGNDKTKSRALIRDLANHHVTDALAQLLEIKVFKDTGKPGGDFCHLALSKKGYTAIGKDDVEFPSDFDPLDGGIVPTPVRSFERGMRHPESLAALADNFDDWEVGFTGADIHAVILAASETAATCARLTAALLDLVDASGATTVQIQRGKQLMNAAGEGIEHFGYVDGRSQPLLLKEDVVNESDAAGTSMWNAEFPLNLALIKDPGVVPADNDEGDGTTETPTNPLSFGSFFIFRKLEQNVRGFKRREQEIATALHLEGEDRELAGAMLVGRFEDGTPVTMSRTPRTDEPPHDQAPPNDFNYDGDTLGSRCPFHSHIRKANPRGSGGGEPESDERLHLMVRRGITYEDVGRMVHPEELSTAGSVDEFDDRIGEKLPETGVGLLFMAYNSSIARQFRFTQKAWANSNGFPLGKTDPAGTALATLGIDPVIGQGPNAGNPQLAIGVPTAPGSSTFTSPWDSDQRTETGINFRGFVTMRGGEYFFSPSLTFLKSL